MDDHELTPAPEPTPLPVPVKPRSSGNRWLNMLIAVAVLVFVGGLTFAVGRMTAPAQAAGPGNRQFPGLGNGQNGGFPTGSFDPGQFPGGLSNRTITGTVTSTDGSTMTLTTAAGQTLTVDVSGSTYHAQTAASAGEVSQGASVQVTVEGGLGFPGGDPGASPGSGAGQTLTASDVTIVGH
jgi:hypothetical protein